MRSRCLLVLMFSLACGGDDIEGGAGSGGAGSTGGASGEMTGGAGAITGGAAGNGNTSGVGGMTAGNGGSGGAGGMITSGVGGMDAVDAATPEPIIIDADGTADWPSTQDVVAGDMEGMFGSEVSGLYLQPASADERVLWASTNAMQARAYRLVESGGAWVSSEEGGFGAGKRLFFPDGMGVPDAESIAKADHGSPLIYIVSERDLGSGFSLESLPAIYRYDTSTDDAELIAQAAWDLTESLPGLDGNQGPEALTFIPDALLVAGAFIDENTSRPYAPDDYPEHGTGLFVVGLESSGTLHVFALNSDESSVHIASADTALSGVMGLELDREVGYLYAHCDDGCDNATVVLTIDAVLVPRVVLRRPEGLSNLNYEGIAISSEAECMDGEKPFFWVEDGVNTHVLQQGTIRCGPYL
jgi:hypothetical protein